MAPHVRRPGGMREWHRTVGSSDVHISQSEALAEGERHGQRSRRGSPRRGLEATLRPAGRGRRSVAFRWLGNRPSERQIKRFVGGRESGEREKLDRCCRKSSLNPGGSASRETGDLPGSMVLMGAEVAGYGRSRPNLSSRATRRGKRHPLKKAAVLVY
jgi:hypothetical protein